MSTLTHNNNVTQTHQVATTTEHTTSNHYNLASKTLPKSSLGYKFVTNTVNVIGVSVKEGQQLTGVEQAPGLFRKGGLLKGIKALGWEINDLGDLTKENLQDAIDEQEELDSAGYKYVLPNIEVLGCMNHELSKRTFKSAQENRMVLTLGGDHGLASGSIHGMLQAYPDLKVIWIDAHGDCNTPETSPSGNYHGMPAAHILGWIPEGTMKAFDWLKGNLLKPENIVFIGLRDLDDGEKQLLRDHEIKVYTPYDIEEMGGIARVMDEALDYLKCGKDHDSPIHLSWDIDGCDSGFITGTGTKARCGITERESHYILKRVAKTGNLVSIDMVEVNTSLEEAVEEDREVLHGDNKLLTGTPTLVYAMEFILSALGDRWL